jgi:hypothetical protein
VVAPRFIRDDLGQPLAGKAPTDLVFGSRVGTPLRVQNFRIDWFDRAADAVGLSGLTTSSGRPPHPWPSPPARP